MIQLTIDGKPVAAAPGTTLLEAAAGLGITIPTLCYLPGHEHISACMVCLVKDLGSGKVLPSCTATIAEGMQIDTQSEDVRDMRKASLELLLSEHLGDCEALCRITCPHRMDIPLMLRLIQRGDWETALQTVRRSIALPGVLGYVCEAPCEKACRRGRQDQTVAIKAAHRFLAELDVAVDPPPKMHDRKRVAVVGAGIAGLTAAYYFCASGHACHLFERQTEPGGYLRYGLDETRLPRAVLDREIEQVRQLGCVIRTAETIDSTRLRELLGSYDAVILACGEIAQSGLASELELGKTGVNVDAAYATKRTGLFAIGSAMRAGGRIVQASADGLYVAEAVAGYLQSGQAALRSSRFNSRLGALMDGELDEFMRGASPGGQRELAVDGAFQEERVRAEAQRCLHCDCRKPRGCKLRRYAEEYGANQRCYEAGQRHPITINMEHDEVVLEPGKCIKCGICVHVAADAGEVLGLAYTHRGYDLTVAVPFGAVLREGLTVATALQCVAKCPTGALALKHREDTEVPPFSQ